MTNLPITGAFSITAVYGQKGSFWANGHKGIDFVANDRRIFATCNGRVRLVSYDKNGWGQYVSIEGDEGYRHIFCHLVKDSVTVKAGDPVTPLTVLGTMGSTGNVSGVHLHYQLQRGNTVVDPTDYLGIPNTVGNYHTQDYQIKENEIVMFKDENSIPQWAKQAVENAAKKGLMIGDDKGNFRPNEPITRAEMAVILSRL